MAHVLAKITGAPFEAVQQKLKEDAAEHAEQGMYLEHLWRNSDDAGEVFFLFRVEDLSRCKQKMRQVHAVALREDPNATLPELIFLDEA